MGKIVLNCKENIENNVEKIKETREYVYNELNKFQKIRLFPANSNFVLLESKYSREIYSMKR
jgi:histidinol-phosphate/aromatic aminotransferase/cobyric acid decarboxylase-like protein